MRTRQTTPTRAPHATRTHAHAHAACTTTHLSHQNKVNQVVLWDRIVRNKEDAVFNINNLKTKYALLDRGQGLRGRPLTLTLTWNVMPKVGALFLQSRSFPVGTLPEEYLY